MKHRKKKKKKTKNLKEHSELWNNFKSLNIHEIGVLEGKGTEQIFAEIIVKSFLKSIKIIITQLQ